MPAGPALYDRPPLYDQEDVPRHWDEYYSDPANLDFTPSPLVLQIAEVVRPGRALDLACGHGRNALYLASLGWQVTAVDSSAIAIGILRKQSAGRAVDARIADLERGEYRIPADSFNLICDFLYLQRDLFGPIREGLKPGGIFTGAFLLVGATGQGPGNPAFRLQPGELRNEFADWKILFYSESAEARRTHREARIIARKA